MILAFLNTDDKYVSGPKFDCHARDREEHKSVNTPLTLLSPHSRAFLTRDFTPKSNSKTVKFRITTLNLIHKQVLLFFSSLSLLVSSSVPQFIPLVVHTPSYVLTVHFSSPYTHSYTMFWPVDDFGPLPEAEPRPSVPDALAASDDPQRHPGATSTDG